jgi:hypothetical protein
MRYAPLLLLCGCDGAFIDIDKVECPVDVPYELVAAYLGCEYDPGTVTYTCPVMSVVPQRLTLDGCDLVVTDAGACDE